MGQFNSITPQTEALAPVWENKYPFVTPQHAGMEHQASTANPTPLSTALQNYGQEVVNRISHPLDTLATGLTNLVQGSPQDIAMNLVGGGLGGGLVGHTLWHGSPHLFDAFKNEAIGTGEGAQAFGHGLYFAENPGVAATYRDQLTKDIRNTVNDFVSSAPSTMSRSQVSEALSKHPELGGVLAEQPNFAADVHAVISGRNPDGTVTNSAMQAFRAMDKYMEKPQGNLYKADIPDLSLNNMLDWDKPLSEQHPDVQSALASTGMKFPPNATGKQIHDAFAARAVSDLDPSMRGMSGANQILASQQLAQAGIPGIKYLDGSSRASGEGTSNFVMFNPDDIRILERNGVPTGLKPWAEDVPKTELPYQIEHKPMTIEGGASPLNDLSNSFDESIYGRDALQNYGSGDPREKQILQILKQTKGNPNAPVTIYRGAPESAGGINAGDWVTLHPKVAQDYVDLAHANEGIPSKVYSMQVPASHVTAWSDSLLEQGYYPPTKSAMMPQDSQAAQFDQQPQGLLNPTGQ